MWKIFKLDKNLANQISAWEVVERPISVIKELVENSIDSWATSIKVEIKKWWKEEISITDNWSWIEKEDMPLSIEKYTTSKIKSLNDLYNVLTFWFRWEALASIASISKMNIISKHTNAEIWYKMETVWWDVIKINEYPSEVWTKIIIKDLFFNTPARLNYLKTDKTEYWHIYEFLNQASLAYPAIWFEFINEGKQVFKYNTNETTPIRIFNIYWENFLDKLFDLDCEIWAINISWFISKPSEFFWNRNKQILFVNNRVVKNPIIYKAIHNAYNRFIPHNMFPSYILKINVDPTEVDVNVHPRKMEVRFANEQEIFKAVYSAVNRKLEADTLVKNEETFSNNSDDTNKWSFRAPSFRNGNNIWWGSIKTEKFYSSWSWTKFNSYSPYKDIKFNPNQWTISDWIWFTKEILNTEEKDEAKTDLRETPLWKIIWQIFNSYIIVESKEGLRILDQHALAERIIYERLVKYAWEIQTQWLLIAESFNVTPNELAILEESTEDIIKSWFDFEIISGKSVIINWIPSFVKKDRIEEVFLWTIKDIWEENSRKTKTIDEIYNKVFATIACRSAIKFWDKLNLFEMNKLLFDASKYYCSTCPHGRSVELLMWLDELKSKFDR